MNLGKKEIQELCRKYNIRPSRHTGQNFLIDEKVLKDIVRAAELTKDDIVLEIGAGFGTLTFALLSHVKKVYAVESDRRLASMLASIAQSQKLPLDIIAEDVRKIDISQLLMQETYTVVANIPYNITSLIIRMLLDQPHQPKTMTLLIQKEVAERILAEDGEENLLSLSVKYFSTPKYIRTVPAAAFWPQPEVDSAVITFENIHQPNFSLKKELFSLMRMAFGGKRKQLHNTLSVGTRLPKSNIQRILTSLEIDPTIRPQKLILQDWMRVTSAIFDKKK